MEEMNSLELYKRLTLPLDILTNIYPYAVSHTAPHRPWSSIVTLSNA